MMKSFNKEKIVELINKEIVPAIGCTEPVAVALAAAKARELLGRVPQKIEVFLSANVLKNAMGVGIPGTGMAGLPIAIALGALIGNPEYRLEVLRDLTPAGVEEGKKYIAEKRVTIQLKEDAPDMLFIEVRAFYGDLSATAVIAAEHSRFVYIEKNGEVLVDTLNQLAGEDEEEDIRLSMRQVYDFAMLSPLEDIGFILESAELNIQAAHLSMDGSYGHNLAKTLSNEKGQKVLGDTIFSRILSVTAAACDARMAGAMIPVMSNSGSGNQGLSATLPVVVYAKEINASEEQLIRALMLSHLTVVYIKQDLGRLSALCGCVVAGIGAACGITYLMGGNYEQVCFAVQNMIGNITGMICDGAKPSCALKVSSGVSVAVISALMALENKEVSSLEGIIDADVDKSIKNMTLLGREAMAEVDKLVLGIMTGKE